MRLLQMCEFECGAWGANTLEKTRIPEVAGGSVSWRCVLGGVGRRIGTEKRVNMDGDGRRWEEMGGDGRKPGGYFGG